MRRSTHWSRRARPRRAASGARVPTPSGRPFTQSMARELATRDHLVLACGRYEGIDQRVVEHAATSLRRRGAVARRLRAERGRGRRAGHRRGGRAAAARLHGQPRVARRGVSRGRPARVPGLHQARLLARPRRTSGVALRRPRGHRRLASRRVRTPDRRPPPRPGAPRGTGRARRPRSRHLPGDPGRRGRALHPDPRLLAAGAVGEPRRDDPGAGGVVRRPPRQPRRLDHVRGARRRRAWSVRRAAGPRGTSGTSAG